MKSFQYRITDPLGMHARPAGLLVKKAIKFASNISISAGDKLGDAKRLFSILGIGIMQGDEVVIEAEGTDETKVVVELAKFFKENL